MSKYDEQQVRLHCSDAQGYRGVGSTDRMDTREKPLLGVKPEWLWREERMYDLLACIARHVEVSRFCDAEWLEELHARMGEVLAHKRQEKSEGASIAGNQIQ